jgi:hypothetical protein
MTKHNGWRGMWINRRDLERIAYALDIETDLRATSRATGVGRVAPTA